MQTRTTSKDDRHNSATKPFFSDFATSTPFFTSHPTLQTKADAAELAAAEELTPIPQTETEQPVVTEGSAPPHDDAPAEPPADNATPAVQTKLMVGSADDSYEREADAIADHIVHGSDVPVITPVHHSTTTLHRQPEEEEDKVELLQGKGGTEGNAPPSVKEGLDQTRGSGSALPPSTRNAMEESFGIDFSDVRVHTDSNAQAMNHELSARAFTHGREIYFNAGEYCPATTEGKHLLAHELAHVVQQTGAIRAHGPIQRAPKTKTIYVPYKIHVTQPMTQDEYKIAAMRQVFGEVLTNLKWGNLKDSYVPESSPYILQVDAQLLKQRRGQASQERGISVGEGGGVTGAEERAKTFRAAPESDQKSALMNEIDRRYFEAIGDKTETKIKAGEKGKAELWRMIRDEVLFQHEYIVNLPPQVKELITFSTKGKDLTPADYDKLFAIAKKIEKMPVGQVSDYASKVTGATTDLDMFEASLDKYIAQMAERAQQGEERDKIQTKLIGLEEVYKKYQLYMSLLTSSSPGPIVGAYGSGEALGAGIANVIVAEKVRKELETQLQAHGFAGVTEFEEFIKKFEKAFEAEAANIAKDLLEKFAGKLYRESERYQNPSEVAALHQKLGGVRKSYEEFEANAQIWNDYVKAREKAGEQSRIPGQGHLKTSDYTSITSSAAESAREKAEEAKAAAQSQVSAMSGDHPIFQEEGLPLDKRIDKVALAKASESELGGLLQGHIQNRMKAVSDASAEIEGKPELIYKMEKLMPQFYVQQRIQPDSIHDMIIKDKMKSDAIIRIVKGLAIAIVGIALAVVSFGAATPAIIATGAAIVGAGLSLQQAYESYQEYAQEKKLADVGFANDPSVVWLVIAVAGAALDMAAAVKAVSALGKAAKVLDAGGDLAEFTKVVRALEKANEIEAKVARAAEKAAAARKGFAEATGELTKAMAGKAYSFPGPLADPEVYKAVVKMARQAIKTKVYDAQKFIEELKLARVNANLGKMNPEELAKAKQAWEEAKILEAAEEAIEMTERSRVGQYTTRIKWGIQNVDARPHTSIKGAFWGRRTPQGKPRVDAYELKINSNNESIFLEHPSGGYVQFENLVGTNLVQDGKLVMSQRSIYHVADMPPFAREQMLAEAGRQVAAASPAGLRVEWLISDARAMQQLDDLFKAEKIMITLRLVPE